MTLAGLAPAIKVVLADKKSSWPDDVGVLGFFGTAVFLTAFSFSNAQRNCSSADLSETGGNLGGENGRVDGCGGECWSLSLARPDSGLC